MTLEEKETLIKFLIETKAIQFGDFKTKSGRLSPYFINTACFFEAKNLYKLASFYGTFIHQKLENISCVYGPAYKGIPLCISVASFLFTEFGKKASYLFNRKEKKTHGDGGFFVGKLPTAKQKIVIVDDVITSGESLIEAIEFLKIKGNVNVEAIVVLVDREEKGRNKNAVLELWEEYQIPFYSLLKVTDMINYMKKHSLLDKTLETKIKIYFKNK